MKPQIPSAHPEDSLLIIGKNSMIGRAICAAAAGWGIPYRAVGSQECDFLDPEAVTRLFATLTPGRTTVVFLAAIQKQTDNSYAAFQNNLHMVRHLMEGARKVPVRSIIYFSSIDVFGLSPNLPITESHPLSPDTYYGMAKATSEWLLLDSAEITCPVTVLRIPGVFGGPGDRTSVIHRLTARIAAGETIRLSGNGNTLRDYVYAADVAEAVHSLIATPYHGRLNLTTGLSLPMREIVAVMGRALGREPKIALDPQAGPRDFDAVFDNSLAQKILPHPPRPFPEALQAMLTEKEPAPLWIIGGDSTIGQALQKACAATSLPFVASSRRQASASTLLPGAHLDLTHLADTWSFPPHPGRAILCLGPSGIAACEADPDGTERVHVTQTLLLAKRLLSAGWHVTFLSSTHVFDGTLAFVPESHPPSPRTAYGRQKAEVERELLRYPRALVVRLSKVVPPRFPLAAQWTEALRAGREITPFDDVAFSPVPLDFVAHRLLALSGAGSSGIAHIGGAGQVSYAEAAFLLARSLGVSPTLVRPISHRDRPGAILAPALHETLGSLRNDLPSGATPPSPEIALLSCFPPTAA